MSSDSMEPREITAEWRKLLTGGDKHLRHRRLHRMLPGAPRCQICAVPFRGIGGFLVRVVGDIRPSRMNPRFCNDCESFARKYPGGAEVDLAMVFADVRGSTALAETMETTRFAELINRFYGAASRVVIESDGLIEKLLGDQLTALYLPGYCGPSYPRCALEAAIELLTVTGHADASGAWLPVGIGVHVGRAYVGAVGTKDGAVDFTALGDDVNVVARLCGAAKPGEIVVSEAAFQVAEMPALISEKRTIELRGRTKPVDVRLIRQGRHRSANKMP